MVRSVLNDDALCGDPVARRAPARVALDGDCCPAPLPTGPGGVVEQPTPYLPVLIVRQRNRSGYDDDGNPMFTWTDLLSGPSIAYEERQEHDAEAGVTLIVATALIGYVGPLTEIPETAMVFERDRPVRWSITGSKVAPSRVELQMSRVWHEAPDADTQE